MLIKPLIIRTTINLKGTPITYVILSKNSRKKQIIKKEKNLRGERCLNPCFWRGAEDPCIERAVLTEVQTVMLLPY